MNRQDLVHYLCDSIDQINNLSYYRKTERVFCYELYYQMKTLQNTRWRECFNEGNTRNLIISSEITKLDNVYPDFVFHNDALHDNADETNQFAVIEVKLSGASNQDVKKDILKIQKFIMQLDYQNGIFLYIGADKRSFISKISQILQQQEVLEMFSPLREIKPESKVFFIYKHTQLVNGRLELRNAEVIRLEVIAGTITDLAVRENILRTYQNIY